jgi:hypothetical protein
MRTLTINAIAAAALLLAVPAHGAVDNVECLACHTDKEIVKKTPPGVKPISLFVDEEKFKKSVHGKLVCNECHADMKTAEHPEKFVAQKVNCGSCHRRTTAQAFTAACVRPAKPSRPHARIATTNMGW